MISNDKKNKTQEIKTDEEGYLKYSADWTIDWALFVAKQESIIITKEHWEVIHFMRAFYHKFNIVPTMRVLVNSIMKEYGKEKGTSRYMFRLFPQGPITQATKISGLPKPAKCL